MFMVFFLITGCAALRDYSRLTRQSRISISQGDFNKALTVFPERSAKGGNEVLIRMERGVLLQALGEYEKSSHEFEQAKKRIRYFEDKAVISATRTTTQAGSLIINEQVQPYEGEDFEKILIHGLDAVNYLMQGDLEGARVEIRNAYTRQKALYDKHAKELEKAKKNRETDWERSLQDADPGGYDRLQSEARSVSSIYQNAFAYYISSLVYELGDEPDEAYIDLKKAIAAVPHSRSIQKDLIRLSKELNFREDTEMWESRYGKDESTTGDMVDVFVIFQLGLAPYKAAVGIPILLSEGGFVSASMPVYRFTPTSLRSGSILYDGHSQETSVVSDTDAIAARNLLDKFPILFAKQIARTYFKARATNKLSREYGAWGAVGGTLASVITEQADLRTWSSLPKEIQVARVFVPGQTTNITIKSIPGAYKEIVDIPEGARHLIVLCRATDVGLSIRTRVY
jgi:hypothetical protein